MVIEMRRAVGLLVWMAVGVGLGCGALADGVSNLPAVRATVTAAIPDARIAAVIVAACDIYPQACACPHHVASNGSICGQRSARTRHGGWKPICSTSDITPKMIEAYCKTGNAADACQLIEQD